MKHTKEILTKYYIKKLESTERKGVDKLIIFLKENNFFKLPASIGYHHSHMGGLLSHCIEVYHLFKQYGKDFFTKEELIISSLLHDVCKVDCYIYNNDLKKWKYKHKFGIHSKRSLDIVSEFIMLTEHERNLILLHMGFYNKDISRDDIFRLYQKTREYKILYFCDELSTILEPKIILKV